MQVVSLPYVVCCFRCCAPLEFEANACEHPPGYLGSMRSNSHRIGLVVFSALISVP